MDTEITIARTKSQFCELSPDHALRLLALLAHNLTVAVRGYYPEASRENPAAQTLNQFVAFNELLHVATGQIIHMAYGDKQRYSDDALIDILFSLARTAGCERELAWAFGRAFQTVYSAASST